MYEDRDKAMLTEIELFIELAKAFDKVSNFKHFWECILFFEILPVV